MSRERPRGQRDQVDGHIAFKVLPAEVSAAHGREVVQITA
jgi:hypothetical protein